METNIRMEIKKNSLLQRCWNNTFLSNQHGAPQFCPFCGTEKMVFFNPLSEDGNETQKSVEILKCDCEKYFKMLNDFFDLNYEWLHYPAIIPKNIPAYSENKARQIKHAAFVQSIKLKIDTMIAQREKLKWELNNSERRK